MEVKRQFALLKMQFEKEKRKAAAESNEPLNEAQLRGATNRLANHFGSSEKSGSLF